MRIFCVVFVLIRTIIQPVWQCRLVPSILKAVERCLWTMEDLESDKLILLQISGVFFLKIIGIECMFRPASD